MCRIKSAQISITKFNEGGASNISGEALDETYLTRGNSKGKFYAGVMLLYIVLLHLVRA